MALQVVDEMSLSDEVEVDLSCGNYMDSYLEWLQVMKIMRDKINLKEIHNVMIPVFCLLCKIDVEQLYMNVGMGTDKTYSGFGFFFPFQRARIAFQSNIIYTFSMLLTLDEKSA